MELYIDMEHDVDVIAENVVRSWYERSTIVVIFACQGLRSIPVKRMGVNRNPWLAKMNRGKNSYNRSKSVVRSCCNRITRGIVVVRT